MASIERMVKAIGGLHDTKDLTPWENSFVFSILAQSDEGNRTTVLSSKQVEIVEKIFKKHFSA